MHVDIGVLRGARLDSARHLNKQGRRARPSLVTCSLIESELYSLSTAGAIAFTACTAAPGQLASLLLRQAPLPTTQPADSLLWTGITVLSALPFCGWVVWPGIGYLRARLDDDRTFSKHYAAFAALYALPLIRAALFGMDELALISVFFCVLHVQAERLLSPVLLPIAAASPTKRLEDTPAPSAAPIEAQVSATNVGLCGDVAFQYLCAGGSRCGRRGCN